MACHNPRKLAESRRFPRPQPLCREAVAHHEAREFLHAAAETLALWARANAYVQEQAPWTALRTDRVRAALATRTAFNLVRLGATVAWSGLLCE
jgi:methionyl-tRNA synthetase